MHLPYRMLTVFTQDDGPFTGNPLAVVLVHQPLDTSTMQAIARAFNLSETTFVRLGPVAGEPSAHAHVRIFTPSFEMPFAGHPTLGTASVVAQEMGGVDHVRLAMIAGVIPVSREHGRWVLTAKAASTRPVTTGRADLAHAIGLTSRDLGEDPLWVDTGVEQLIIPLATADAVMRATPNAATFAQHTRAPYGESLTYLWAATDGRGPATTEQVLARLFVSDGTATFEDPATGSACANLGGWMASRYPGARRITVSQGEQVYRPSTLHLEVSSEGTVRVGGGVLEVGRGHLSW